MPSKRKIFSSLKDSKYEILSNYAKKYDVSESEIIRIIVERVLGNQKYEKALLHDVMKDLVNNDDTNLPPLHTNIELFRHDDIIIPDICPECGKNEEMGIKVISYSPSSNLWRCSNCFASGGL